MLVSRKFILWISFCFSILPGHQGRKTELHHAIVNMEQGGSADGILQVNSIHLAITRKYKFVFKLA